jgi:hypothetical protein
VRPRYLGTLILLAAACNSDRLVKPVDGLPYALATPSCGPADGPATIIVLASTPVELPQPSVPYIQVFVPRRFTESTRGDVFEIGDDINENSNAWFYRSGVETKSARRGEVGITALRGNQLTGYVDLEFPDGARIRGAFSATFHSVATFCG